MSEITKILDPIMIPKFYQVKQYFHKEKININNIGNLIINGMKESGTFSNIKKGQKIGITAGSRGIKNITLFIKEIAEIIKSNGATPYIIPCMGSHGGGNSQGQTKILNHLGITEDYTGAKIKSSMEVVNIGKTKSGLDVFVDKHAYNMDSIIVINRIKPHTAFRADIESGIQKMLVIGLGKQKGAQKCHHLGFGQMYKNITEIADVVIKKMNIAAAIGIIENPYDETYKIEVMNKNDIQTKEKFLLEIAKRNMPRILFNEIDVLIVEEMGKNIAGGGMDTNIISRFATPYITNSGPKVSKIVVLDLTKQSKGNATGMGNADYSTQNFFKKINFEDTYPNALTAALPGPCKIPVILPNDMYAIKAGIITSGSNFSDGPRIVKIKNTLKLEELLISEPLLKEAKQIKNIELLSSNPTPLKFDNNGYLSKKDT